MEWFTSLLIWYLYLFVLGVLFFPLVFKLFSGFIDHGYAFAKTVAIILVSYATLLLGILHILPFTKESLILILVVSALGIFHFCKKEIQEIKKLPRKSWVMMFGVEVLFFLGLLFLTIVRGHEPSIHGLEKFMDFGFIQAIGRSTYFPPQDMWLSPDYAQPEGYPINYYYFGHLLGAVLIKLTGISPYVAYNLILASILGQGLVTVFSLVGSITHQLIKELKIKERFAGLAPILIGIIGAFIVNLGGNLHTLYLFTTGYPNEKPEPFWGIFQTPGSILTAFTNENGFLQGLIQNSSYWYPNATRFIPYTIHEFPSYSYVVADLHGHVFDIPFVVLTLALIWIMYVRHFEQKQLSLSFKEIIKFLLFGEKSLFARLKMQLQKLKIQPKELLMSILIGGMIGINYMTNAFDGPIYLLLMIVLLFFLYRLTVQYFIQLATIVITFVIVTLPFSWFFDPFANQIGVNCSPDFLTARESLGPFIFEKGNCQISEPYMLFILWGFFWISAILLIVHLYKQRLFQKNKLTHTDWFLLFLFGYGTFLVIVPEFFYAKDIYPGHFRANTMFKMGYQAFMMMGMASAIVMYRIGRYSSWKKYIMQGVFALFFFFVFLYPFTAFPSYYPRLSDGGFWKERPQIDGAEWMRNMYPQDMEIIEYINTRISGQPVILEAQGDSYTDYNKISAYTGNPTVAGWWVHQWLWRGSSDIVGARIPDIEALYQSDDVEYTKQLIDKYQIEYVVVSTHEKERYSNLNEEKFSEIGTKIFESSNSLGALYKVY